MKTWRRGSDTFTDRRRKLASGRESCCRRINEEEDRSGRTSSLQRMPLKAALKLSTCESQMPIHLSHCMALGHCGDSSRRLIDLPFWKKTHINMLNRRRVENLRLQFKWLESDVVSLRLSREICDRIPPSRK